MARVDPRALRPDTDPTDEVAFYSGPQSERWHSRRDCPRLWRATTVRTHEVVAANVHEHGWIRDRGERRARLCDDCLLPDLLVWLLQCARRPATTFTPDSAAGPATGPITAAPTSSLSSPLTALARSHVSPGSAPAVLGCAAQRADHARCRVCAHLMAHAETFSLAGVRTDPDGSVLLAVAVPRPFHPVLAQGYALYPVPGAGPPPTPRSLQVAWDLRTTHPGAPASTTGSAIARVARWHPHGLTPLHDLALAEAACIVTTRT